jgi:hypothetical protein
MDDDIYRPSYEQSRALIIGINDYLHVSPLGYAVNDAEGIREVLIRKFEFPSEHIVCLLNSEATRERIMSTFLSFAGTTKPDDRLVFFFAGHGHTISGKRGEVGYLIPYDASSNDLATLIRWDDLTKNADLIPAKHMFFIMDACYGGLAITRALPPGAMRFLDDMLQRYARQVLTAGKANETVSDFGGPLPNHSVFTGHLIEALNGKAETGDGVMTANGIMSYVYERVSKDPNSHQTPHYGFIDGDGDFIFKGFRVDEADDSPGEDKDILISVPATVSDSKDDSFDCVRITKEYLSEARHFISLHDLATKKIREYISNYTGNEFILDGQSFAPNEFLSRIKFYEKLITELQSIAICISYWGGDSHRAILKKIFTRIGDPIDMKSGLVVWLNLRWYPVMLLTYASGISAIAANKYDNLSEILLTNVLSPESSKKKINLVLALGDAVADLHSAFKAIPGHEKNYVPRSEYLFKLLQPVLDDVLFLGRDYENMFDRFEVLFALIYADLSMQQLGHFWGPPGRFAYKRRSGAANPFNEVVQEAEGAGDGWQPLKQGFFQGSIDRFIAVKNQYAELLNKNPLYF